MGAGPTRAFAFEARWGTDDGVRERARHLNATVEKGMMVVLECHPETGKVQDLGTAARMALLTLRTALTEAVLFEDVQTAPPLERDTLKRELVTMLTAYLTGSSSTAGA